MLRSTCHATDPTCPKVHDNWNNKALLKIKPNYKKCPYNSENCMNKNQHYFLSALIFIF